MRQRDPGGAAKFVSPPTMFARLPPHGGIPHNTPGRTFPNDPIMISRRCLVACSIPIPRVHELRRIMFS